MGRLAKTDRVDAQALAELAAVLDRRPDVARFFRPLPHAVQQDLAALVTRRRQLTTMLLSERQRLRLAVAVVRPSVEAVIAMIRQQLDDIEAQMVGHVRQHYAELDALLQSAGGIGPVASASLIADLPIGSAQPPPNRRAGRRRALRQGLWPAPWPTTHRRRALRAAPRFVHGHGQRHSPQPGHPGLLRAPARRRRWAAFGSAALYRASGDSL